MRTGFKVCGLTRPADAADAVEAGAEFIGVIFAGGPRMLTPERAALVTAEMPQQSRRVGVFGSQTAAEIARIADASEIGVAQLHGTRDPARVAAVREATGMEVWAVVQLAAGEAVPELAELFAVSNAVLLDARSPSGLGGSGMRLAWGTIGPALSGRRPPGSTLILAGGLTAQNAGEAIAAVRPELVDVSSGIELEPGIKNPALIRAFADSVGKASKTLI